ncbi:hypothetical protein P872_10215 [Rhodonellum psychrophilum GCM71 = DSM 17998]|uniref:Uncharacterized protein n=2 Tax=Rhodonellum TaxID=336827 RepID=U5BLX4_9BACT|nr:hypothetical protein P872_10215 [Rhodonellum psychrophilum GCM71 = DSM 17998]SDZ29511.1 hypothetical protein SAMN05444412_109144 [Rhodonellum ikkaensis]
MHSASRGLTLQPEICNRFPNGIEFERKSDNWEINS